MTDRELLAQALDALEIEQGAHAYLQLGKAEHIEEAITALRERLAQPEQSPLDRMAENARELGLDYEPVQEPKHDYRTRYDRGCYKCGSHYCPADCHEPTHLVAQKPNTKVNSEAIPEQISEPVAHSVVAGALFDFMGWLTSRRERLVLSSTDNASPAADAIKDFAQMRSLSINDAQVQDWQEHLTTPPRREWVGLTDEEADALRLATGYAAGLDRFTAIARAIEAKLKEKNS